MVTWQQIGQGEPNPFDVTYTTNSTYSASYGEFVITEGDQVDLPSPSANAAVAVRSFEQTVAITTPSGNIRDSSTTGEVYFNSPKYVILVSDGTNWYVQNNESGIGPVIPDAVVNRPNDDDTLSGVTDDYGVVVEPSQDWPDIGAEISNNTVGATRAYIYDFSDGSLLGDVDISGLTAGETFTFGVSLSAGGQYSFVADAEGASYDMGRMDGTANYPYTSSDGNLELTGSIESASLTSFGNSGNAYAFTRIGDVGFS